MSPVFIIPKDGLLSHFDNVYAELARREESVWPHACEQAAPEPAMDKVSRWSGVLHPHSYVMLHVASVWTFLTFELIWPFIWLGGKPESSLPTGLET